MKRARPNFFGDWSESSPAMNLAVHAAKEITPSKGDEATSPY